MPYLRMTPGCRLIRVNLAAGLHALGSRRPELLSRSGPGCGLRAFSAAHFYAVTTTMIGKRNNHLSDPSLAQMCKNDVQVVIIHVHFAGALRPRQFGQNGKMRIVDP